MKFEYVADFKVVFNRGKKLYPTKQIPQVTPLNKIKFAGFFVGKIFQ